MTDARRPVGLLWLVVLCVGMHSCVLGLGMLFAPIEFPALLGFPEASSAFFPSQSGIFLLALGICYLLALRNVALVQVILVSKALAVVFLVSHAAFLDGPPVLWAAAGGDAGMLAITWFALRAAAARIGFDTQAPERS